MRQPILPNGLKYKREMKAEAGEAGWSSKKDQGSARPAKAAVPPTRHSPPVISFDACQPSRVHGYSPAMAASMAPVA
ncbi:hypothetical protein J27TS7_34580 [Paenibacillus dendritiformis]|uniref:hypothetical protein n=1 Tax=Paenibacillus dendritiformis TaxID=130049 RepID=UPI00143CE111|nr:hypothetical protein [Paenibacillus dendritiformis]NKI22910.1 hypothetical protein [Paenibacillus dendritiformis]NRF96942.1 hypothetical protein [Paenibacillus dendritiformis]GIO73944.1 hypothetical protein J27TS7_34580 [Paenibacillus dendritiformis]